VGGAKNRFLVFDAMEQTNGGPEFYARNYREGSKNYRTLDPMRTLKVSINLERLGLWKKG
jgi:hypothetical protein